MLWNGHLFFSILIFAGAVVFATSKEDITFPVAELGNCQSEEACEAYCDLPENMEPCLDFAESHNLIPEEEIAIARKMLSAGEKDGPGSCRGQEECDAYCDEINHLPECLAFAEKYDLMPPDELAEARKIAQALEQGFTPPNNCRSKEDCDVYCSQPANMKECITFAKAAGLIPPEELEEVEKVLAAIEQGVMPPPCGGRDACDEYCSLPEHLEECITFAEAAGFMSPEEAAMVRRTGGKGPGDCRGKEACEAFCEDPANMGPCVDFAVENGFMSAEEAEQVRKMMAAGFTSGPGGCKGQEECETFCDEISHMTECVDFAEKTGMMSPEDASRARKMAEMGISGGPGGCKGEEECRAFCDDPDNMETCLNFAIQIGDMSPEEAEQMRQGKQRMAQTKECLAMPCSEAFACLGNLSQGEPTEQGEPAEGGGQNPEIQAKVESCLEETKQAQQECLAMPCPEALACLQSLSQYAPGDQEKPEEDSGQSSEIQAKIQSCVQEMMPQEGMTQPEGFEQPEGFGGERPEGTGPTQEETDRMIQEETQRQMETIQQQIEQQMQQQEAPQSFFEAIKNFVAGLVPAI